jgi:hypothetical protein
MPVRRNITIFCNSPSCSSKRLFNRGSQNITHRDNASPFTVQPSDSLFFFYRCGSGIRCPSFRARFDLRLKPCSSRSDVGCL